MPLDFMFSMEMHIIFGVMFLLLALGIVSLVSGENPCAQTVWIVGVVLIILSASAVMYIENMKSIASNLVEANRISKDVVENFNRGSNLFLFVFPIATLNIGINLLTEVITRDFKFDKKNTFNFIFVFFWNVIKKIIIASLVLIFTFWDGARKSHLALTCFFSVFYRRIELMSLKVCIVVRSKLRK
ncbi:hypothetical protein HUI95_09465 [Aeromonas dhakensis]|uniref:hypothetical protein n=1 Tax=Aeromonas dhakensis TaxID=196024 RepID=UPI001A8DC927|nr:hypothetical protein [Aeromonas dhakensis]QSR43256.1 hypothetical protein HUI95_09465 [Aeromonas dhakensis]